MRWPVPRPLIVLLLCLGLIAPMAGAAVAGLTLGGAGSVIICTGDGLRTITLDATGKPVTMTDESRHCALIHAVGSGAQPGIPVLADAVEPALHRGLPPPPRPGSRPARAGLSRAPPVA